MADYLTAAYNKKSRQIFCAAIQFIRKKNNWLWRVYKDHDKNKYFSYNLLSLFTCNKNIEHTNNISQKKDLFSCMNWMLYVLLLMLHIFFLLPFIGDDKTCRIFIMFLFSAIQECPVALCLCMSITRTSTWS